MSGSSLRYYAAKHARKSIDIQKRFPGELRMAFRVIISMGKIRQDGSPRDDEARVYARAELPKPGLRLLV